MQVARLAREQGYLGILGNHELATLRAQAARQGGLYPSEEPAYAWTDEMEEEDVQYLRKLPYTISLPAFNAIVVHAGLVPGIPLGGQCPLDMVSMRNLVKSESGGYAAHEGHVDGCKAWAGEWSGQEHVYFGHDAVRKLQQCAFATGLDTACVYGGKLTAAILENGQPPRLVSVPARDQYVTLRLTSLNSNVPNMRYLLPSAAFIGAAACLMFLGSRLLRRQKP